MNIIDQIVFLKPGNLKAVNHFLKGVHKVNYTELKSTIVAQKYSNKIIN